jgi:hypothetical protein
MSTVKALVDPKKGSSSLIRPRFSPGLMLQDSDLNIAVDYSRSLTQLLFKHLFGCGVICGYEVSATVDPCNILEVKITRGLALDCLGSPVELSQMEIIRVEKYCMPRLPKEIWVVIKRREECCGPRDVACAPDDPDSTVVCTRIKDGYEIRLLCEQPKCACGCAPELKRVIKPDGECCQEEPGRQIDEPRAASLQFWHLADEEEKMIRRRLMEEGREKCYKKFREGVCSCECCCDWILLARLFEHNDGKTGGVAWRADHTVRRFIRPVLSPDYFAYDVHE